MRKYKSERNAPSFTAREIATRRRDDARVERNPLARADGLHAALGERAKELRLRLERELAELVEKHGAALREDERRAAIAGRTRERSARVTEERRLGEAVRNRSAIDDDERTILARRALVDRLRDELLARSRLAFDEHRQIRRRASLDSREDLAHRGRASVESADLLRLRQSQALGLGGLERDLDRPERKRRLFDEVPLLNAHAGDPNPVLASDIAHANALRSRDELGVHRAHALVIEDERARRVASDEHRIRADRHAELGTRDDAQRSAAELDVLRRRNSRPRHQCLRLPCVIVAVVSPPASPVKVIAGVVHALANTARHASSIAPAESKRDSRARDIAFDTNVEIAAG